MRLASFSPPGGGRAENFASLLITSTIFQLLPRSYDIHGTNTQVYELKLTTNLQCNVKSNKDHLKTTPLAKRTQRVRQPWQLQYPPNLPYLDVVYLLPSPIGMIVV